jgi:predicted RNA-binding Zn ribbon-like protein
MSALRLAPEVAEWAQAAADLVNTGPRPTNPVEQLLAPGDLEQLLPEPPPPFGAADLPAVREARARLYAAFAAADMDELAAALNPLLGEWGMQRTGERWVLGPAAHGGVAVWVGARAARGLAELATTYGLERLHICHADDCSAAVVDVSRNGNRRYCSRTCASRVNVRRFRELHAG